MKPLAPRILAFDVFGTVVDWHGSIRREIDAMALGVDGAAFALAWRAGYQPAMRRVMSGELGWTLIDDLHRMILDEILERFGVRHLSEAEAFEALEQVLPLREKIVGIGLASSELGHPPEKFAKVFARCRALGFRLVAHAGEEGPPAYIWSALDQLKVERIDHGVQAIHDAALMQRLARDKIALTVCPLSNLKLCVFDSLAQHNIGRMLDAGIVATVNSDDPAYFGGYINENFRQTFAALGLSAQQAWQLAANSFNASFITDAEKRRHLDRLDAHFETFR